MSDKQNLKEKFNNCFLDLQRAATSFYLNPKGKTHQVFLQHARKILGEMKSIRARKFSTKILEIEKEAACLPKSKSKTKDLADKMLTLGLLLKRSSPTPSVS